VATTCNLETMMVAISKQLNTNQCFLQLKLCAYYVPLVCNLIYLIIIYKHDIDMKLYALTFKVGKYIIRTFKISFFQMKYNSRLQIQYNAQTTYGKGFPLPIQRVITKMINHNNQILLFKTFRLYFHFVRCFLLFC